MNIKEFYRKHTILSTLILMMLTTLVLLIIVVQLTKIITFHGQEYETPNLVGKTPEELSIFLDEENVYHFKLEVIDSMFIPDQPKGVVLNQDPAPGSKVKKRRKIYLTTVAVTAPQVEMPNLVDLSLRQAENLLKTNNLQLGQVIYKSSKYNNAVLEQRYKGRIIATSEKVPYMAKITLVVGKEEQEDVDVDLNFE